MKIIKRGVIKEEDPTYEHTCHHCKTVFEFKRSEGEFEQHFREGPIVNVVCPVCGEPTTKFDA